MEDPDQSWTWTTTDPANLPFLCTSASALVVSLGNTAKHATIARTTAASVVRVQGGGVWGSIARIVVANVQRCACMGQ